MACAVLTPVCATTCCSVLVLVLVLVLELVLVLVLVLLLATPPLLLACVLRSMALPLPAAADLLLPESSRSSRRREDAAVPSMPWARRPRNCRFAVLLKAACAASTSFGGISSGGLGPGALGLFVLEGKPAPCCVQVAEREARSQEGNKAPTEEEATQAFGRPRTRNRLYSCRRPSCLWTSTL